jgi:hypothetical protein
MTLSYKKPRPAGAFCIYAPLDREGQFFMICPTRPGAFYGKSRVLSGLKSRFERSLRAIPGRYREVDFRFSRLAEAGGDHAIKVLQDREYLPAMNQSCAREQRWNENDQQNRRRSELYQDPPGG